MPSPADPIGPQAAEASSGNLPHLVSQASKYPVMKGHEDGGICSLKRIEALPGTCPSAFCPILRKEVIQPQVPLRLPCYDFTPVTVHSLGPCLLAVSSGTSGANDSHGVTGGVYKARERIHRGMLIRDY